MDHKQDQKKRLIRALVISSAINILLLSTFFYWLVKETPPQPYCELKPVSVSKKPLIKIDKTTETVIRSLFSLSLEQLIGRLNHKEVIENGYSQRDLALGVLVSQWFFDLPRALANFPTRMSERSIPCGKNRKGQEIALTVYPGMTDEHYQSIIQFTKSEKWPVTSQGLFLLLKKGLYPDDNSLAESFFLTTEFMAVETLFSRSETSVSKLELQKMLLEGNWQMLELFTAQQKLSQDLSPARRQRFLLDYISKKSGTAAELLLKTDADFAAKKLDDHQLISVLSLLESKSEHAEKLAMLLLKSPRSDAVRHAAANKLYEFAGELKPQDNLYAAAIARFIPQVLPEKEQEIVKPKVKQPGISSIKKSVSHTVKEGDSLWKIAKKYQISVKALKEKNKLSSDTLKPGMVLTIERMKDD